jgi:tRNA threonylcarbamoyladenosine biosynthesis protein TsaB
MPAYIIRLVAMEDPDSLVLAVDTTSRRASVAVARGGRVAALLGIEADARQSSVLWSDVDLLLGRLGASVDDVAAFAVARGPGAFTGLRVGIAAAAGLARATGRPLYGATSLELTARASGAGDDVWVVLNAYRNEVYAQPFRVGASGAIAPLAGPTVEAPQALFARLGGGPLRVVGSGAEVYLELLEAEAARRGVALGGPGWTITPAPAFLAGELALHAHEWLASGRDPGRVEPCYVRPSEAEINLKAGRLEGAGVTRIG